MMLEPTVWLWVAMLGLGALAGVLVYLYRQASVRWQLEHAEVMQALLDGAITRAKIHALVERMHDDLCGPDKSDP